MNNSKLTAEHPCQPKPTSDLEVGRTCQVLRTHHPRESRVSCQPKLTSDLPGSAVHSWWLYRSPSTTFGTQVNTLGTVTGPIHCSWIGLAWLPVQSADFAPKSAPVSPPLLWQAIVRNRLRIPSVATKHRQTDRRISRLNNRTPAVTQAQSEAPATCIYLLMLHTHTASKDSRASLRNVDSATSCGH